MTYDIQFLEKRDDQSWDDALAAHRALVGHDAAAEGMSQRMRPRFDHVADAVVAADARFERVDGRGFVEVRDPELRIQLHLFAYEVSLTIPFPARLEEAREIAQRAAVVARIVERETGYHGYDPQLGQAFPGATDAVERAAHEMIRIRRRIDRRNDASLHGDGDW